ncbi:hypothetical protein WAI453_007096 [Rhynchosporium graminicola]|uniref:Uncharacterized protein n=1 Tax=Rhynchosporium graminicola TaxID=2792576 RepID=A0A1E1LHK9_9HELO|nr:uncharacterized protein RCO7_02234 [Rhynchosporium commune]
MNNQEELAALFERNLSLQPIPPTYVAPPQEEPKPIEEPYVYSISQHYHHSSHIVAQQPSRPASEPPQTDQLTTEIILARHGIDVATLFPTQVDLFKTAEASQQMRLIELWRICPPNYGGHALAQGLGDWPATSFQQEEAMAKLRYERQMLEERMARSGGDGQSMESAEDTMSDASTTAPLTPIQAGDGRWQTSENAEPYMQSGYESLAQREYEHSTSQTKNIYSHYGSAVGGYRQAIDPVYSNISDIQKYPNVGGDWTALLEQRQQAMENQYGAYDQQFHHNQGGVTVSGYQGEDEEML